MPRLCANVTLLFTEHDFLDRFAAAADAGFEGVELLFPYAWPARELRARLADAGLELVLFNLRPGDWEQGDRGLAALPDHRAAFRAALDEALGLAEVLGCRRLHVMAGLTHQGADRATYVDNLAVAAEAAAPLGIDVLIEPINTFDMPGYFLTRTADAIEIIREVAAPNLGLQLDLYHRQRMEGRVPEAIQMARPYTRHYQIAAPRDRGEPEEGGELDLRAAFADIDAGGYAGWIGCEYRPRGDTRAGLEWFRRLGLSL
ncbi:MAG: 2-oxo-tetronate isomerase [Pseudomonadota bacterium]